MKSSKIFIFTFLILILVATVQAQDETFQFNKEFDLKRACFDRGGFCGAGFECNITLIYPDGTMMVDNKVLTDQNSYRNITITQVLNNQLGELEAIESCTNTTDAGAETFKINITADGKPVQAFPTQFVIIILSFILVGVGQLKDRLRLFQTVGAVLMMIMGVLTLWPGYSYINYSNLMGLALGVAFIGLGFYFMIEHNFSRNEQKDGYDERPSEEFEKE